MAKAKTTKSADKPTDDNSASQAEVTDATLASADTTLAEQHAMYGTVKPTMVNGVYVGGDDKAEKPAPSLEQIVAGAFTNQAQIDAVMAVLAVASGKAPADSTAVGALSPDVDERLKLLEQHAETVDDHLQEVDARALAIENRLTALETVAVPPES